MSSSKSRDFFSRRVALEKWASFFERHDEGSLHTKCFRSIINAADDYFRYIQSVDDSEDFESIGNLLRAAEVIVGNAIGSYRDGGWLALLVEEAQAEYERVVRKYAIDSSSFLRSPLEELNELPGMKDVDDE